ncbi:aspartate/glutamate racemase family protein [Salinarimonas ramus]|uniref:Aspartate racemase n=1 Tax=Salinarimonas ramus TaxID=690164 RepID=A0A917V5N5_9HYPH|nr:amino acid racemase [Salinarimonas ramus]GGK41036.1 aspartate racemase [Salinarimonas ramus]
MRKIGIVGGLSWVSSAAYYQRLNELATPADGGVVSLPLVLESVDRAAFIDAVVARRDEAAARDLVVSAAKALEAAGAEVALIACNEVHRFIPAIAEEVRVPFVHIVDAVATGIRTAGMTKVGLLGVRKTMEGTFYSERLAPLGIETIVPREARRQFVHDAIYDEFVRNVFTEEARTGYLDVVRELAEDGAQGVILGCTKIPLLLRPGDAAVPLFDTIDLHCRAALEAARG